MCPICFGNLLYLVTQYIVKQGLLFKVTELTFYKQGTDQLLLFIINSSVSVKRWRQSRMKKGGMDLLLLRTYTESLSKH